MDGSTPLQEHRAAFRPLPSTQQPSHDDLAHPLRLRRGMRLRLRAAVLALLAEPSIAHLKDAPKLAAVVLYAKSRAPRGGKRDNMASIWGEELGRWLGMSESTVHHKVLPPLRAADALHTSEVRNSQGRPTGLDCLLMPLWKARKAGGVAHPLALSQAELATLLRLCEALFGPGWTPKGRPATPPGLLAQRQGRGAATDRLGLLLLVLNTRATGWLQLCGGSVKTREGRGAATLARLLGCSPAAARKVLARLTKAGVVARTRRETATRLQGRGRVMLLPVAQAYGRRLCSVEVVPSSQPVFSQRPVGAVRDHARAGADGSCVPAGECGAEDVPEAVSTERPGGAEHHAIHPPVVTPSALVQVSCGFSGTGRGGKDRQPERECVRENRVDKKLSSGGRAQAATAEQSPLRGEQHDAFPMADQDRQTSDGCGAGQRSGAVSAEKVPRPRRVSPPDDLDVQLALAPVAPLWERLSPWQKRQVEAAAQAELQRLRGLTGHPAQGPRLLADRLGDRLRETGGEALVDQPYPWLIRRGLVQRSSCPDPRCDDGIRLDTGSDCENCINVIHLRRAHRATIAARITRELPHLTPTDRRRIVEEQLRERTDAKSLARRHQQIAVEREQRTAALQARRSREQQEHAAAAVAAAQAQAQPCRDCGAPNAAGHCPTCASRESTERLLHDAVELAVAVRTKCTDADHVAALVEQCTADTHALLARTCERAALRSDGSAARAETEEQVARRIRMERRHAALQSLARSQAAVAAGDAAYAAHRERFSRAPKRDAERAARAAEQHAAEQLLNARLDRLAHWVARNEINTHSVQPADQDRRAHDPQ
ncbi:hypothetical protein [Streptomyces sp. NPDC057694]|uniref:hypothetical protein n=1 Tax=Streptomyces sp. NPDC057694 TaxID=3346216 RepID=UPI0036C35C46